MHWLIGLALMVSPSWAQQKESARVKQLRQDYQEAHRKAEIRAKKLEREAQEIRQSGPRAFLKSELAKASLIRSSTMGYGRFDLDALRGLMSLGADLNWELRLSEYGVATSPYICLAAQAVDRAGRLSNAREFVDFIFDPKNKVDFSVKCSSGLGALACWLTGSRNWDRFIHIASKISDKTAYDSAFIHFFEYASNDRFWQYALGKGKTYPNRARGANLYHMLAMGSYSEARADYLARRHTDPDAAAFLNERVKRKFRNFNSEKMATPLSLAIWYQPMSNDRALLTRPLDRMETYFERIEVLLAWGAKPSALDRNFFRVILGQYPVKDWTEYEMDYLASFYEDLPDLCKRPACRKRAEAILAKM